MFTWSRVAALSFPRRHRRYPSASFTYKGVYYVGTYAISETWGRDTDAHGKPAPLNAQYLCGNWCVLGPFIGFRSAKIRARDEPLTWRESRMEMVRAPIPHNIPSHPAPSRPLPPHPAPPPSSAAAIL